MERATCGARYLLACTFALAGLAKALDRTASRRAVEEFGVPARFASPLSRILPAMEFGVVVLLLPARSARWGAKAATALLVVFNLAVGTAMATGRRPDCHCFGTFGARRVGLMTIARNAALTVLAAFVAVHAPQGQTSANRAATRSWGDRLRAGLFSIGISLAIVEGGLVLYLSRRHGELLRRVESIELGATEDPSIGLPAGELAPVFGLTTLGGATVRLAELLGDRTRTYVFFIDSDCGYCERLLPELGAWQREEANGIHSAIITTGNRATIRSWIAENDIANVLYAEDYAVHDAYKINRTPAAVVVNGDGTVERTAGSIEAVRGLLGGRPDLDDSDRAAEQAPAHG